jgi:hypothetical protein
MVEPEGRIFTDQIVHTVQAERKFKQFFFHFPHPETLWEKGTVKTLTQIRIIDTRKLPREEYRTLTQTEYQSLLDTIPLSPPTNPTHPNEKVDKRLGEITKNKHATQHNLKVGDVVHWSPHATAEGSASICGIIKQIYIEQVSDGIKHQQIRKDENGSEMILIQELELRESRGNYGKLIGDVWTTLEAWVPVWRDPTDEEWENAQYSYESKGDYWENTECLIKMGETCHQYLQKAKYYYSDSELGKWELDSEQIISARIIPECAQSEGDTRIATLLLRLRNGFNRGENSTKLAGNMDNFIGISKQICRQAIKTLEQGVVLNHLQASFARETIQIKLNNWDNPPPPVAPIGFPSQPWWEAVDPVGFNQNLLDKYQTEDVKNFENNAIRIASENNDTIIVGVDGSFKTWKSFSKESDFNNQNTEQAGYPKGIGTYGIHILHSGSKRVGAPIHKGEAGGIMQGVVNSSTATEKEGSVVTMLLLHRITNYVNPEISQDNSGAIAMVERAKLQLSIKDVMKASDRRNLVMARILQRGMIINKRVYSFGKVKAHADKKAGEKELTPEQEANVRADDVCEQLYRKDNDRILESKRQGEKIGCLTTNLPVTFGPKQVLEVELYIGRSPTSSQHGNNEHCEFPIEGNIKHTLQQQVEEEHAYTLRQLPSQGSLSSYPHDSLLLRMGSKKIMTRELDRTRRRAIFSIETSMTTQSRENKEIVGMPHEGQARCIYCDNRSRWRNIVTAHREGEIDLTHPMTPEEMEDHQTACIAGHIGSNEGKLSQRTHNLRCPRFHKIRKHTQSLIIHEIKEMVRKERGLKTIKEIRYEEEENIPIDEMGVGWLDLTELDEGETIKWCSTYEHVHKTHHTEPHLKSLKAIHHELNKNTNPVAVWAGIPPILLRPFLKRAYDVSDVDVINLWKNKILMLILNTTRSINHIRNKDEGRWREVVACNSRFLHQSYSRREWIGATADQERAMNRLMQRGDMEIALAVLMNEIVGTCSFTEVVRDFDEDLLPKGAVQDFNLMTSDREGINMFASHIQGKYESVLNLKKRTKDREEEEQNAEEESHQRHQSGSVADFTNKITTDEIWEHDNNEEEEEEECE